MLAKTSVGCIFLSLLLTTKQVLGRETWLERDGRPVFLYPRRFGQERPAVLQKLQNACPGQVCGTLAGQAVTPLLAAQPECSQQDMADAIIDASKQFDSATQANMVAIAIEYRQAEKNTPSDFTTNPPTLRNSVFCQKPPKNPELNGLVQAQDPANDPDIFFDPALGKSVRRGEQPNTLPFNGSVSNNNNGGNISSTPPSATRVTTTAVTAIRAEAEVSEPTSACVTAITVTVTATNPAVASVTNALTVTVGGPLQTAAPSAGSADFGSCTTPEIEFGVGFDNRQETSFRPVDRASYPHDSAQNINIITQFVCDSLTNTCKANQKAKDLCTTAITAASSSKLGTGAQADAFNAVFGIQTRFVDIASVDNQGNAIPGTGAASSGGGNGGGSATEVSGSAQSTTSSATTSTASAGGVGNFASCSTPQIEFGVGFDGRKQTSFRPADLVSFNHGSAQNIGVITKFICDELTNSCRADQTAKDTCARATTAATSAPAGTGAQADAFNAVFGIRTNFADVQQIDGQGRLGGDADNNQTPQTTTTTRVRSKSATTVTATASPISFANNGSSNPANLQSFTGALGGVAAPAVRDLGNGRFLVDGNSEFNDRQSALARSCDVQNNKCADAANASRNQNGFTVQACNQQQAQCKAAAGA